jgi:asparagine N-glycosylation enzyme membrane subunit Stt3
VYNSSELYSPTGFFHLIFGIPICILLFTWNRLLSRRIFFSKYI